MRTETISDATMILGDCMDYMATLPDKAFELAIVDPPYGIGMADRAPCGRLARYGSLKNADNNAPDAEYFSELFRVSKNQIIWGGNYFNLPPTRGFLIWDKQQPEGVSFASCEMAWTNFNESARTFYFRPQGDPYRIHPTQKPVALYKWLLSRYAKPGDRILDTHGGSFSSVIACIDLGHPIVCIEKDKDYFEASLARVRGFALQPKLLDDKPASPIPQNLFEEAAK